MRKLALRSGLEEEKYDSLLDYEDCLDTFELIYLSHWKEANAIYTLPGLSDDVWAFYDSQGIAGLAEQKLLEESLTKLRKELLKLCGSQKRQSKMHSKKDNSTLMPLDQ